MKTTKAKKAHTKSTRQTSGKVRRDCRDQRAEPHAGRGHPKLTPQQKQAIRRLGQAGETQAALGREFGVSSRTIGRVLADAKGPSGHRRRADHRAAKPSVDSASAVPREVEDSPRAIILDQLSHTREFRDSCERRGDHMGYVRLLTAERKLVADLAELDAQQPPDPRLDPANRQARDDVRRMLIAMLDGADVEPPERDEVKV